MAILDILFQDTEEFMLEIPSSVAINSPKSISFDGNNFDAEAGGGEFSYVI